jgi:hypothetical protein
LVVQKFESQACGLDRRTCAIQLRVGTHENTELVWKDAGVAQLFDPARNRIAFFCLIADRNDGWGGAVKDRNGIIAFLRVAIHVRYGRSKQTISLGTDLMRRPVVDAQGYRDVARLGRKTRLPEGPRKLLWSIFERVQSDLISRQLITWPELFTSLGAKITMANRIVFDFAVVDEAQDISPSHLRFLAALGAGRPNALFFAGDLGQRIFQQSFSWKSLGVDIRGRSRSAPRPQLPSVDELIPLGHQEMLTEFLSLDRSSSFRHQFTKNIEGHDCRRTDVRLVKP